MIKVFLVEDESIIRKSIRENIPWTEEGMEFAGEAADGELALPMILEIKPDILITDIKMPFMDGLELSAIVKKKLPDTRIIILSGYKEFDYAKTAINIGVSDFHLKPITSAELLSVLNSVKSKILSERVPADLLLDKIKKQNLLNSIIAGNKTNFEYIEEARSLGYDIISPQYTILQCKFRRGYLNPEEMEIAEEVTADILSGLSGDKRIIYVDKGIDGVMMLLMTENSEECSALIDSIEAGFRDKGAKAGLQNYYGAIGRTVNRLSLIGRSYRDASVIFSGRFVDSESRFVRYIGEKGEEEADVQNPFFLSWKPFEIFYSSGEKDNIDAFLSDLGKNVRVSNPEAAPSVYGHIAVNAYYSAKLHIEDTLNGDSAFLKVPDSVIASFPVLSEYIREILLGVLKERDDKLNKSYSAPISRAISYMNAHFGEYQISLNRVSEAVNMSSNYFSTIFAKETGKNFVEYLTEIRIEKAKEYLLTTMDKPADIALKVGYQDGQYFSHVFKKVTGMTPREYRENEVLSVRIRNLGSGT